MADWKEAARTAATWLIDRVAEYEGEHILEDDLRAAGDLDRAPEQASREEHKTDELRRLQFRTAIREHLRADIGRELETIPGVGFRLLAASQTAPYAESAFFTKVQRAGHAAQHQMRSTNTSDLTQEERVERADAQARVGLATLLAEHTQRGERTLPPVSMPDSHVEPE